MNDLPDWFMELNDNAAKRGWCKTMGCPHPERSRLVTGNMYACLGECDKEKKEFTEVKLGEKCDKELPDYQRCKYASMDNNRIPDGIPNCEKPEKDCPSCIEVSNEEGNFYGCFRDASMEDLRRL